MGKLSASSGGRLNQPRILFAWVGGAAHLLVALAESLWKDTLGLFKNGGKGKSVNVAEQQELCCTLLQGTKIRGAVWTFPTAKWAGAAKDTIRSGPLWETLPASPLVPALIAIQIWNGFEALVLLCAAEPPAETLAGISGLAADFRGRRLSMEERVQELMRLADMIAHEEMIAL